MHYCLSEKCAQIFALCAIFIIDAIGEMARGAAHPFIPVLGICCEGEVVHADWGRVKNLLKLAYGKNFIKMAQFRSNLL
ncbi:MAG: hypothetical protein GY820_02430 [Gammaproteobacteria bacterium]|nr:hypothetical protein [Gammaproteobacteria bacterium]